MHTPAEMMPRAQYLAIAMGVLSGCATAQHSGHDAALSSGEWRAIEISGQPVVSSDGARRPSLTFQPDSGRVTGSGGCNRLAGPFTQSGSSLTFGALAMTRMACVDAALNAQETAFAAALHDTDRYAIAGDTLTLLLGTERRVRLVR
jgi:heat shock protein HslJ